MPCHIEPCCAVLCCLQAWCAFCFTHSYACRVHPLLLEYGVGLDCKDLQHLVLGDREAEEALNAVAAYLRTHTRPGLEVFAERGTDATFLFALSFAQRDHNLKKLLTEEQASAQARKDAHWAAVQAKQREAASLRQRISTVKYELANLRSQLNSAEGRRDSCVSYDYRGRSQYSSNYKKYASKVDDLEFQVRSKSNEENSLERQLENTLKPPADVIQPLPANGDKALQVQLWSEPLVEGWGVGDATNTSSAVS